MRFAISFALLLGHALAASAQVFQAGAAKVDITPPIGFPMWGYANRHDQPSMGVLDPLFARIVVLSDGTKRVALVSLDLGRAPTRDSVARIRKKIQVDGLFLVASHTHHGPVLELDSWPTKEKPYVRALEERLVTAINEAATKLQPARWGVHGAQVPWNRNRHSQLAVKPIDSRFTVVRIEDLKHQPIAHLVNFAAHPTFLSSRDRRFSADYPGALAGVVEKELGGMCLFLQGASGDLAPRPDPMETYQSFGVKLGRAVIDASPKILCKAPAAAFQVRQRDFVFAKRIDVGHPLMQVFFSYAFFPALVQFYEREYRDGIRPTLTTFLWSDQLALVGGSGEFFCQHAVRLHERSRLEHVLFLGYCNDYHQYFPTIEGAAEGGYGGDELVAPVELGAGEKMMDRALIDLFEMRGKLRTMPAKK